MQNNYIPEIFKEKLSLFFGYFRSLIFMAASIFLFFSLLTFDINDNSFLTSSNGQTNNTFGSLGAYISSFVLYAFGLLGYGLVLLFSIISLQLFYKKSSNFFFIKLFIFSLSLILIPQIFIYLKIEFKLIDSFLIGIFGWTSLLFKKISIELYTYHKWHYFFFS